MNEPLDYSLIAEDYAKRPAYAKAAIEETLNLANLKTNAKIADIGAGTGRLSRQLAEAGYRVMAIEPEDSMRFKGMELTQHLEKITWQEGTAEETGLGQDYDLVIFGSSFHCVDRELALREADNILKPGGFFACLWNHRDFNDPLQAKLEEFLLNFLGGFGYGVSRQDQSQVIQDSGLFTNTQRVNKTEVHSLSVDDFMAFWRSHAILKRGAGPQWEVCLKTIERLVRAEKKDPIDIPFVTRGWVARKVAEN